MKTQAFNHKWFIEQFGERPKRSLSEISQDIDSCRDKLFYLEKELQDKELYMAREDAALKSYVNTLYERGVFEK